MKNVHNHLQVVLPDADFRDDAMLTTAANNALMLNVTVPDGVEATAKQLNRGAVGMDGSAGRGHHAGCAGEPGVATAGGSAEPGGTPRALPYWATGS